MERQKLLSSYDQREYDSIDKQPSIFGSRILSKILVYKPDIIAHNYKQSATMLNGKLCVIKNIKDNIDIAIYDTQDNLRKLLVRYMLKKQDIKYVKLQQGINTGTYEITLCLIHDKISTHFAADEAIMMYTFLKKCLKSYQDKFIE